LQAERAALEEAISVAQEELDEVDAQLERKASEVGSVEKEIDEARGMEEQALEEMNEAAKVQDKLLNKRTMLVEKAQEKQRMIRDLGTLPNRELEEFQRLNEKQLLKKLQSVNEGLKKYSSVNKKALDQYVSFNEQRSTLILRRDELVRENEAIEELIQSLDGQKEEAIMNTFQGVSRHFTEVFSELVPGGKGELVMSTVSSDPPESSIVGDNGDDAASRESSEKRSSNMSANNDDENTALVKTKAKAKSLLRRRRRLLHANLPSNKMSVR
jgi:structural maintenance of chromosome 3 (chondroitin sulfate proteoglycan 6)